MKRNSVLRRIPAYRKDPATWPKVEVKAIPLDFQDGFIRNRKAVHAFIAGATLEVIRDETGRSAPQVRELLRRCLLPDGNGDIFGERALVPYARTAEYARTAAIERDANSGRGYCAGALKDLFAKYPEIEDRLKNEVLKQVEEGKKLSETRISYVDLQRQFLLLCKNVGLEGRKEWPFNTKSLGKSSLRNFVEYLSILSPEAFVAARYGADARTRMRVGTGHKSLLISDVPFDIVGIDEFTYDGIGTIEVDVAGGGTQDIAVDRVGFAVMVDLGAKPILSLHAFYSGQINANDFRSTIQKGISPAQPMTFTLPGLDYGVPDAGFPSGLIASMANQAPTILMLDNLTTHLEIALIDDIGRRLGSWINFGPVAQWYRRAVLERTIGELLRKSAHRLPSTTGSNPQDTRRDTPVETAIRYKIRWAHLCEIAHVAAAQFNATPNEGIGFLSPIALLRQHASDGTRGFCSRPLPRAYQDGLCIKAIHETVTVRGSQEEGDCPHVNIDRVEYTNHTLSQSWNLISTELLVGIDGDDMRSVSASLIGSGVSLGVLHAKGPWSRTQHTRTTRKAINRLKDTRVLVIPADKDPVVIYFDYLRKAASAEAGTPATPKVSRSARKLAEGVDKTGVSPPLLGNVLQGPISLAPPTKREDSVELLSRQPPTMRDLLRLARGRRT